MNKTPDRQLMAPEDMARCIEDIQQRAVEVHEDIKHLMKGFHLGPGPYAQMRFAQISFKRGAESLAIGSRLALEVKQ